MPEFNDLNSLYSYLEKQISETLKKEVFEEVRDVEIEQIEETVIKSYEPQKYRRRKDVLKTEITLNIILYLRML
jgi:hypothetical protein